ncbi:immunoglobulin-like domain-containing protein, partial [Bifidobacterium biavatii]
MNDTQRSRDGMKTVLCAALLATALSVSGLVAGTAHADTIAENLNMYTCDGSDPQTSQCTQAQANNMGHKDSVFVKWDCKYDDEYYDNGHIYHYFDCNSIWNDVNGNPVPASTATVTYDWVLSSDSGSSSEVVTQTVDIPAGQYTARTLRPYRSDLGALLYTNKVILRGFKDSRDGKIYTRSEPITVGAGERVSLTAALEKVSSDGKVRGTSSEPKIYYDTGKVGIMLDGVSYEGPQPVVRDGYVQFTIADKHAYRYYLYCVNDSNIDTSTDDILEPGNYVLTNMPADESNPTATQKFDLYKTSYGTDTPYKGDGEKVASLSTLTDFQRNFEFKAASVYWSGVTDTRIPIGGSFNPSSVYLHSPASGTSGDYRTDVISNNVDTTKRGKYTVVYNGYMYKKFDKKTKYPVSSWSHTVYVGDWTQPVFSGVTNKTIAAGSSFDPKSGVTAKDETDGDVTSSIKITGAVNPAKPGSYTLTYTVSDK